MEHVYINTINTFEHHFSILLKKQNITKHIAKWLKSVNAHRGKNYEVVSSPDNMTVYFVCYVHVTMWSTLTDWDLESIYLAGEPLHSQQKLSEEYINGSFL